MTGDAIYNEGYRAGVKKALEILEKYDDSQDNCESVIALTYDDLLDEALKYDTNSSED